MSLAWKMVLLGVSVGFVGCTTDPGFEQPMGGSVHQMISAQTAKPATESDSQPMRYQGTTTQRSLEAYRSKNGRRRQTQTIRVGK